MDSNQTIDIATAIEAAQDAIDAASIWETFDTAKFCDAFCDAIVATLRRDPRWAAISPYDLDFILSDVRQRFAHDLARATDNLIDAQYVVRDFRDTIVKSVS